jgi:chromosome transmission fidelity protein 18
MRSVLGAEPRPNCLVIDEIDGAQAASINVLVDFINGKSTGKKGKKKGEDKASFLKRPVICICNDAFVPALKPLKPHALVVNFPPTTTHR